MAGLRAFVAADLPDLLAAFADPEIARWNPGPESPDQAAAAQDWMDRRNDWSAGTHASWAIADADGRLCGSVSLHELDRDQLDSEIGYWLAPWARRRGLGTQAVGLAGRYGFRTLGLRRIYLFHAVDNPSSCRLAGAAGYLLEGELRQSHRYPDGRYHDEHLHARLAGDPEPPTRSG